MCARQFGLEDPTSRRSICEDVARERALDLMDGHVMGLGLCELDGVSSVRRLDQGMFRAFLAGLYQCLKLDGCRMFPFLADGRTRRPTNRWPAGAYQDFQGWFHTLDAFEAGPVAAYATAYAVWGVAMAVRDADVRAGRSRSADAVMAGAREAMDSALLARPGEFGVLVNARHPAVGDDDERITALVARHGGLRWERSKRNAHLRIATFRSLQHAVDAQDALRADEAVEHLSAGSDWDHFFLY